MGTRNGHAGRTQSDLLPEAYVGMTVTRSQLMKDRYGQPSVDPLADTSPQRVKLSARSKPKP